MYLKRKLKQYRALRSIYRIFQAGREYFSFKPYTFVKDFCWFLEDFIAYKNASKELKQRHKIELYPCLKDKTQFTPIDPVYFYQDCWAAGHIFRVKPDHHYDVGSSVKTIGIISQFVPVTFVDIRPPEGVRLQNLNFVRGSILNLPFKSESIYSLSSLCVIEHIGLGRYGDPIDPLGHEKAIAELSRVLRKGGMLLISVPVDNDNKVYFNAHRAFHREYLMSLFSSNNLSVLEEKYIYGYTLFDRFYESKGFGTGLYLLTKE